MCGIEGIISNEPVVKEGIRGLRPLENRGRNSSGIIVYDSKSEKFTLVRRGLGSSQQVFNKKFFEEEASKSQGNILIGHNRYSTAGSDLENDAQPLLVPKPGIAMAHNGQVLNIASLKEQFKKREWYFQTECDVEPLMIALAQGLIDRRHEEAGTIPEFLEKKLYPALESILREDGQYYVNGAYSVVAILAGKGLLAFRDAHGIRPLSYGVKKEGSKVVHAFASETSVFNYLGGYTGIRSVERGEAIFIDEKMNAYSKIIHQGNEAFCGFEWAYFAGPDSDFFDEKVYDARLALGSAIARHYADKKGLVDVIMAVPRTSIPAAIQLAAEWGKPYKEGMIVRGDVRSFLEATQNERERAVTEKMIWIKSQIKGHDIKSLESSLASKGYRIGLVEDSLVRGTTLREIIKKLRALGAQEVHVFSTYDMIRHPCVYGIDTPEEDKLIAARLKGDVQAIAREIGADSVNYLPWTEYGNAIGVPNSKMCFACVNGNYATDTSEYQAYLKMRKKERESLEKNRKI